MSIPLKRKKNKLIVKFVVLFLLFYIIFLFISQQFKIREKKAEIQKLNDKVSVIQIKNDELREIIDGKNYEDKFKPGTRIFENILE